MWKKENSAQCCIQIRVDDEENQTFSCAPELDKQGRRSQVADNFQFISWFLSEDELLLNNRVIRRCLKSTEKTKFCDRARSNKLE